jgi:hypothetical protein
MPLVKKQVTFEYCETLPTLDVDTTIFDALARREEVFFLTPHLFLEAII